MQRIKLTNQRILINYSLQLLEYSGEFPVPEKLIKAVFVRVSRGFRSDDDWWVEWNGIATRWVGVWWPEWLWYGDGVMMVV